MVSGAGAPDAPRSPQLTCRSPHSALVMWDEPFNNGAAISEYRLEWTQTPDAQDFAQVRPTLGGARWAHRGYGKMNVYVWCMTEPTQNVYVWCMTEPTQNVYVWCMTEPAQSSSWSDPPPPPPDTHTHMFMHAYTHTHTHTHKGIPVAWCSMMLVLVRASS